MTPYGASVVVVGGLLAGAKISASIRSASSFATTIDGSEVAGAFMMRLRLYE